MGSTANGIDRLSATLVIFPLQKLLPHWSTISVAMERNVVATVTLKVVAPVALTEIVAGTKQVALGTLHRPVHEGGS